MFILWVRYWLIYSVQSACLPGLVSIYKCLFNQKWLGTPVLNMDDLEELAITIEQFVRTCSIPQRKDRILLCYSD